MFDSIHNVNDFFSSHWLAESYPAKLKELVKEWKSRTEQGKHSPLQGLSSVTTRYLAARASLPGIKDDSYANEVTKLHRLLLDAVGIHSEAMVLTTQQAGTAVTVPLMARIQSPGSEALHVLQACPVTQLDELFADEAMLLEPMELHHSETKIEKINNVSDAVQRLFLTEDAPRYLLVIAGSWLVLADVQRWAEGRYLAFDLDTALSRRDDKPAGELAWHAGLWSADVLLPSDDGTTAVEAFSRDSVKHAVGVSADLREGLRISVEVIANAVIAARRERGDFVDGDADLPRDLTRQSLRFLYRILFLLYAESRPELGILPVGAPEYGTGYGLDRFRELVQQPMTTEQARNGTHLHDSLRMLFRLVNDGYRSGHTDHDGLVFEPLRADLFEPKKAHLVDDINLPNHVLAEVLGLLLLSKPDKKRARGYVSYAQLGINQLGAVYEGLMSYSGFIADRRLIELAKDGDADKGTWLVPAENVGQYDEKHVVKREESATGAKTFVIHESGTFVYRLSGRDRQRSASYYTPEVLTRTVVKHALAELITADTTAAEILDYRICEPALGSGAFLNEAINQLARAYLDRRQAERNETIPPEDFQPELQKVKAHLALHRAYGVDLNQTAVELAEVSLWLNVMHPGLQAPWFGLHLRRGNSLIGGRRAVYDLAKLAKSKENFWTTVPTDRPLHGPDGAGGINDGEVHHFLLPAAGWGAVGDAKQAKELAPERAAALRAWRKSMLHRPDRTQSDRLRWLGQRVERMWELTLRRLEISEREVARKIDVWGHDDDAPPSTVTREQVESALHNPESPYQRVRLAMDLWCALFFWPVSGEEIDPPDIPEWLDTLEDLLGLQGKAPKAKTTVCDLSSVGNRFDALGDLDDNERVLYGMRRVAEIVVNRRWVGLAREISKREGFFHWELDYAHLFAQGGFDLQVGNPPWVRLNWQDDIALAERNPSFMLDERMSEKLFASRRNSLISEPHFVSNYLVDVAANVGAVESLSSEADHSILAGLRGNLYMNFMERTWRSTTKNGVVGLLHPESHFSDPKAGRLRAATYARLRRHWQFINEAQLFTDIHHQVIYGIHIYSTPSVPKFVQMANLQVPETLEQSLIDDGSGEIPGLQFPWGGWDLRPHASRLTSVDIATLATWAALFDRVGTPANQARLLRPLTTAHLAGIERMASVGNRMGDLRYNWSSCFNETTDKAKGTIAWKTAMASSWHDVVLQGPHFFVANPFYKMPNEECSSNLDWASVNLLGLGEELIPRTNYQRACAESLFVERTPKWDGRPCTDFWRLAWRNMTQSGSERSLISAVIPPGPVHINSVHSLAFSDDRETGIVGALWASLPFDYLVKISGASKVNREMVDRFPVPLDHPAMGSLLLRMLRLNCLTNDFADIWDRLFDATYVADRWTSLFSEWPPLGNVESNWTVDSPLRSEFERRAALVEIDALSAIALGLTADQLVLMYTGQFAVLRKYEYTMWFDVNGDKIAKETHAKGVRQREGDFELLAAYQNGNDYGDLLKHYVAPFFAVDREREMRSAHAEFSERLGL